MNTFPLQVLRINENVFEGDVISVTAPGSSGELTILAKHETLLTSLKQGEISIKKSDATTETILIEHGFVEATSDKVIVLL